MRRVSPKVYDKKYYLNVCLGSDEFRESQGKLIHDRWKSYFKDLDISRKTKILDVGCGRGDLTLYLAKNAKSVIGIDYSRQGISIANEIKKTFSNTIQKRIQFRVMDIKKLLFDDNEFDLVILVDVLEHLYKEEVETAMDEISRVLKKDGVLFIHTGPNKILYDKTYKYYILPVNKLLTKLDQLLKGEKYNSLPIDPRTSVEKIQHVNEPTYSYLKRLFKKHKFEGNMKMEVGFRKPNKGIRSSLYNLIVTLYPFSTIYPLNTLFAWSFRGKLKNIKSH